ncbi:MAG TPA: hypothetical protein PK156_32080 [Polyangium sp.]|nr:hypothetical protein [Polyangium sp.]
MILPSMCASDMERKVQGTAIYTQIKVLALLAKALRMHHPQARDIHNDEGIGSLCFFKNKTSDI